MPFRLRSAPIPLADFDGSGGAKHVLNTFQASWSTLRKILRRKVTDLCPSTSTAPLLVVGMVRQPSTDGHLGIPRNSYQVPCLVVSTIPFWTAL